MGFVALFLFVLIAQALGGLWPRTLGIATYPPDLWIVLVVFLALSARGFSAVGWAIALGLLKDSLSLDPLGTHAFVFGMVAFFLCEGRRDRSRIDGIVRVIATAGAALGAGWLYLLRMMPVAGVSIAFTDFLYVVPAALFTTCVAAALHPFLDHYKVFDDLLGRRRGLPA